MEKIEALLNKANVKLKAGNVGLTIYRRGSKLSLRGMLPPKLGQTKKSQQTISLDVYANRHGVQRMESEAKRISGLLALDRFSWTEFVKPKDRPAQTLGEWVEKFEADYFSKRSRTEKSIQTWKTEYRDIYNRVSLDALLTKELLLELVLQSLPDTRTRLKLCIAASALAKFAIIDLDLSDYKGNYSPQSVEPRDLPSDKQIFEWYDRMPEKHGWKYAFGLMAAYGLRNHELFHLDLESLLKAPGHLTLLNGKTGGRKIWCLYPHWWEQFELYQIDRPFPQVTGENNSALGQRVTQAFRRYGFYKPYNLRHAWAIRTIQYNLPVEMSAAMMGHSVEVHCQIYKKFLTDAYYEKIYKLFISNRDRY